MRISNSLSDKKMPIYLQIYKQILADICAGKWKPGDRLPADMQFAKELNLNHLTLKKALNRLAAEGYLTRTRGRGTFISPVLPKQKAPISGKRVSLVYDVVNEESFHGGIFLSIYREIGKLGLTLELLSSNNSRTTQFKQIMDLFSDPDSAGCIVWPLMDMRQLENLAAAKPENYPLIFINHKPGMDIRGIDFSGYDDFGAGQMMGEYINSLGFEETIICQPAFAANAATNVYRIAGLKQTLKCPATIFSDYESACSEQLHNFLSKMKKHNKTAVVFVGDGDSGFFKRFSGCNIQPFVFFTAVQPFCPGIQFSPSQMGENAIKILQMRRNGDDSFSITRRLAGKIV
ncbi:MAG: GntR family transcriptional regulator [Lentisphaeria bacterium]|nr:GntR family transcriptional regulator [Lentisphaeria bacterium]